MKSLPDIGAERSLYIRSSFDDSYIDDIIEKLFFLNQQDGPILLYINSNGGTFNGAVKLYEHILLSRNEVIGVVAGFCFGGAAVFLQGCKKRYATPFSSFLLFYSGQYVEFGVIGDDPIDRYLDIIKSKIALAGEYRETTLNMLKRKMRLDEEQIHALLVKKSKLNVKEALEIGLIDEIIDI